MEKYMENLKRSALFESVQSGDLSAVLKCLGAASKHYDKNERILNSGDEVIDVGILAEGRAQLIKEDAMGNRNIIGELEGGDLFAESFVCAGIKESPVTVVALESCTVLFIQVKKIIDVCGNECSFHKQIINNLLKIIARKNLNLNKKLDYLSLRTTREKLLGYLNEQQRRAGTNPFKIPLNRAQLADYLCVDRSAMSRELGKLRDEEVLHFKRSLFYLRDVGNDGL
ncbi:Crp/Fnr family transcriptional regulator [Eubacterium sp. 1001713B170207_170306_E7]|uniref:Crp/Fnr family transcriptional regulator n=1 Tax=Eubacterium sp. 1001713B170207_170306_E7 TaxID=2787097 RepID=UPI00189A7336|nr:Crp/Fnr family transcriptional regulator [Eubacterium sp. 1001713B170207_170306_E7]